MMGSTLLKGGRLVDGTGRRAFRSDVLVEADRIVSIGTMGMSADEVLDCSGLFITPGFIDIHNHSDYSVMGVSAVNYIAQGVTTLITGLCGQGAVPVGYINSEKVEEILPVSLSKQFRGMESYDAYVDMMRKVGLAINTGFLVPHGSIRSFVMGLEDREPTDGELEKMISMVEEGMAAGALGLSTGLAYVPSKYAKSPEIKALCEVVGRYDGIYSSHMRNQGDYIVDAIIETVETARETGARPLISHIKATRRNTGLSHTQINLIEYYKGIGLDVDWDIYAYARSGANIVGKIQALLDDELSTLIQSGNNRPIMDAIEQVSKGRRWDEMFIRDFAPVPAYEGLSIAEISELLGTDISGAIIDLLRMKPDLDIAAERSYEDMIRFFQHPDATIGSDGYINNRSPHPRSYGAFTRVLTEFVLENKFLTFEDAVKKMTWNSAQKLRVRDRGLVREGMKADLAIFNPMDLRLEANFKKPHEVSRGMSYVMINGTIVWNHGRETGERSGQVIQNRYVDVPPHGATEC